MLCLYRILCVLRISARCVGCAELLPILPHILAMTDSLTFYAFLWNSSFVSIIWHELNELSLAPHRGQVQPDYPATNASLRHSLQRGVDPEFCRL